MKPLRKRSQIRIETPSRTVQSARDPSDVNYIVNRYQQTGDMPRNPRGLEPQYVDTSEIPTDLTEAHNLVVNTQEAAQQQMADYAPPEPEPEPEPEPAPKPPADPHQPAE